MPISKPTMWCLTCRYVLDGISAARCPECGRLFNPDDPQTYRSSLAPMLPRRIAKAISYPWTCLALVWITSFLSLLSCFAVPLLFIGSGMAIIRRRWITAVMILALTPFSMHFMTGVLDYFQGDAALRGSGLPGRGFSNLHPVYRCGRSSSGCVVYGNEWVRQEPYNSAIMILTQLCGPMPGAYAGPYPSDAQALQALRKSSKISLRSLRQDRIPISGQIIKLHRHLRDRVISNTEWSIAMYHQETQDRLQKELGPVTGVLYEKSCLILSFPLRPDGYRAGAKSSMIVLIDATTGRSFATYWLDTRGRVMFLY